MALDSENIAGYCSVGSIIRAPYPSHEVESISSNKSSPSFGRAVIATVSIDSTAPTVSCIWEDRSPSIFSTSKEETKNWIVPTFHSNGRSKSSKSSITEEESDVPISLVKALLPFEKQRIHNYNHEATAKQFKECGDELLRLRDFTAAVEMYEAALSKTCRVGLGETIILNEKGFPVLAEIDCIEESISDSNKGCRKLTLLDVTYINANKELEGTVTLQTDVLLIISSVDRIERLQERILLNMARCLSQLAKIDLLNGRSLYRPDAYRKAAVMACTLAITSSNFYNEQCNNIPSDISNDAATTEVKARILRAIVYMDRAGYYKHALLDLHKVLKIDSNNQQAKKLIKQFQNNESRKKKLDRKLAKDVCQWIESSGNVSHI